MSATATPLVRSSAPRGLAIVVAAAVAALAVWLLAGALTGSEPAAQLGGAAVPVGLPAVAAAALVAGLVAWAVLAVLERTVAHARRVWSVTMCVGLVLSLAGPLGGVDGASILTLAALHLVTGAVLIPLLPRARAAATAA
jgi:hypothetical protein